MRSEVLVDTLGLPLEGVALIDLPKTSFLFSEKSAFVEISTPLIPECKKILIDLPDFLVLAHAAIALDEAKNGKSH